MEFTQVLKDPDLSALLLEADETLKNPFDKWSKFQILIQQGRSPEQIKWIFFALSLSLFYIFIGSVGHVGNFTRALTVTHWQYHKTDLPSTLPCGWFFETLTSSSKFCWHGIFGWWLTYTLWYFWMMRYLHPWTKEGYVAVSIEWVLSKLLSLSPHQISVAPNLTETCDFSQKRVLNILDTKCMMRVPGCIGRPNGTHELQNMVWLNMRGGVSSGCCFHYCYC